jgi:spermidine synthase
VRWLFLFAYACSGFAGLVYEVSWTRLLTLYLGHTTAAASAVVSAFLGGLAVGAAVGGRFIGRLTRRQGLQIYIALECVVIVAALALPLELAALTPLLERAYQNGAPGVTFVGLRLLACVVMIFVPATALGATFPAAAQWFAASAARPARDGAWLYALNTAGAAVGAILAGFILIPAIGLKATLWVAMASTAVAACAAWIAGRGDRADSVVRPPAQSHARRRRVEVADRIDREPARRRGWLAAMVLGVSGFAALVHEIAWTRILALVLGPTIYAFAATLAAVIAGAAFGAAIGAWLLGRARNPANWLGVALALATLSTAVTYSLAGSEIPRRAALQAAAADTSPADPLWQGVWLTALLILPSAVCLGAAFPLALAASGATADDASQRFGLVYAVNTLGSVAGSLAAGFLLIPRLGLQATLVILSACLAAAALAALVWMARAAAVRASGALLVGLSAAWIAMSPPWDRELLASGAYLYAPFVPADLDLETQLRAGTLLYYREGASSTVTVKKLTGTTTLAVDGKTDASNRGDMLTQKLAAHLPLLLHDEPREIGIIGLGSGVTLASALRHPVSRVDVIEISPEVVEASAFFEKENGQALRDPRTRLIVGDGRSHLALSRQRYDVIVSEPSNPWIAGVAALFTREFFQAARERLAPGGLLCQWANAYTIDDRDLRAIVGTFASVFPDATVWLVGNEDVLLVGSSSGPPVADRLEAVARHWSRAAVRDDLTASAVLEPFSLLSLFVGGPPEIARYADGTSSLTDDRMALEFSGPRDMHRRDGTENSAALTALLPAGSGPPAIARAYASAGAREWRNRAAMMARRDAHGVAFDDFTRAFTLDPTDASTLDGLVRTAILLGRAEEARSTIQARTSGLTATAARLVAISKLQAASGAPAAALATAREAARITPPVLGAFEQVAALVADAGDLAGLDAAVVALEAAAPGHLVGRYYAAVLALLRDRPADAARLGEEIVARDRTYAPVYDLVGAAYTRLDRPDEARRAFETSLTLDARDSTAYTNLGLLALAAGDRPRARNYFAEALWLEPQSSTARAGLARTRE